jgi:nucleoside-diphosphate-sugar epimerase
MLRANPLGARLVIGNAVRLGLDPVVHCSSVTALLRPGAKLLTADMPPGTLTRGYARSKVIVENYVRSLQAEGAPVVITYPGSVTGPAAGDVLGEATQGVAAILGLGMMPTREGAMTLIDARDLGALHAALMVGGQGPRRFMCGGHFVPPEELARQLGQLTGRRIRVLNVPGALMRGAGILSDVVTRALPALDSPFTHEAMIYLTHMPPTDDSALQRELGIGYRSVTETLRESVLAARAAGLVTDLQVGALARRPRSRR